MDHDTRQNLKSDICHCHIFNQLLMTFLTSLTYTPYRVKLHLMIEHKISITHMTKQKFVQRNHEKLPLRNLINISRHFRGKFQLHDSTIFKAVRKCRMKRLKLISYRADMPFWIVFHLILANVSVFFLLLLLYRRDTLIAKAPNQIQQYLHEDCFRLGIDHEFNLCI